MQFEPERYLNPYNEPAPHDVVWGFGRKICAGRVFADASIYLTCVQSLAALNVRKAVDEMGTEIEPKIELLGGAIGHPAPFKCKVSPRSKAHEALIERAIQKYAWEESDAKYLSTSRRS